jgi:hypothetical protein
MSNRELEKLEKLVPERAVAALTAATQRALASHPPRVLVIDNGLYRVSASGEKELIRMLTPRMKRPGRAKRSRA